jgi:hypothetical protein
VRCCVPYDHHQLKGQTDATARLLSHFRRLTGGFAPAVLALQHAIERRTLTDSQAGALATSFFAVLRRLCPSSVLPDHRLLEQSRAGFYYLLTKHTPQDEARAQGGGEVFTILSLRCPISQQRLEVGRCIDA